MDSERGDRINAFLIVPHVFFLKRTHLYILVKILKFYSYFILITYYILYLFIPILYSFLLKRYARGIFAAGLSCPHKRKKSLNITYKKTLYRLFRYKSKFEKDKS